MATRKATLTPEEKLWFAIRVKEALNDGAILWVSVPHTSASNMSYTIRARLIGGATDADIWLNYWLAAEIGATLNDTDDIRRNGCGFDRAFEVARDVAYVLEAYGLVDARYEYEIKYRWF